VFEEATKSLLDQIETVVKLIRSKGVGVYFVTQNPKDVPEDILAQLGLKIQHSLRAFTANDRQAIRLTAQNFPDTEYYETESVLTSMGIGEAFVTEGDSNSIGSYDDASAAESYGYFDSRRIGRPCQQFPIGR